MQLLSTIANQVAELLLSVIGATRGILREHAAEATKQEEKSKENQAKGNELAHNGGTVAIIGPLARSFGEIFLQLVGTKLVVDEATKRNGVTEKLKRRDRVTEDDHGRDDEQYILEDTREGKNER